MNLQVASQKEVLMREEGGIKTEFPPVVGGEDDVSDEVALVDVFLPGQLVGAL